MPRVDRGKAYPTGVPGSFSLRLPALSSIVIISSILRTHVVDRILIKKETCKRL